MDLSTEKTNIIITRIKISENEKISFIEWQSKLNSLIANFPGFLSLEILSPDDIHSYWTFIQRFSNHQNALQWKDSIERKKMFDELSSMILGGIEENLSNESEFKGITEVFITEVDRDNENTYRKWLSKIHQAEAKVPGFLGMYVQAPIPEHGKHWITFLQFDTSDNLDLWLNSRERQELLNELNPMVKTLESHRVITPYAGWFNSIVQTGTIPPVWKQTMLVLLVLFPIVMFEIKYLSPLTKTLNLSIGTFIGNAISVVLISWPMMPIAIYFFRPWLNPQAWNYNKVNYLGTGILCLLYLFEVIIFWNFL